MSNAAIPSVNIKMLSVTILTAHLENFHTINYDLHCLCLKKFRYAILPRVGQMCIAAANYNGFVDGLESAIEHDSPAQ
ncbi:MAG: hypothetical protein HON92_15755 [Planctomycetaceae bacterium]|nr:hypothetical protein [Planctomycetaceae bacterium]MBT5883170.1 hypothetical protein [Planctomycetaceae bacterium]